jgi:hypothetical protein
VLQAGRQKAAAQAALACSELNCLKPSVYRDCLAAMINDQSTVKCEARRFAPTRT